MKRRDILKYTAYVTGAAVSLPLAATLLSGCKTDGAATAVKYQPIHFNEPDFSFLEKFVDIILPKTDSPSASEVGVHKMIDSMTKTYSKEAVHKQTKNFKALQEYLKAKAGENEYTDLSEDEKISILKNLDASKNDELARTGYLELKQQTIAYYLNTEEIANNHLNYDPIPGDYVGCINLSDVNGKAWAQ